MVNISSVTSHLLTLDAQSQKPCKNVQLESEDECEAP